MSPDALWELLGERQARATDASRGPWNPASLHGGPVAALLARAVEHHPTDGIDWFVSRLTVELERPVPVAVPLEWTATTTRPGRKVSLVDVTLTLVETGAVLARARALRIRRAPVALPYEDPETAPHLAPRSPLPGPETAMPDRSARGDYYGFHNGGTEHRFVEGSWASPGAVVDWVRLNQPVVGGDEPTPLQRVAAAADFPNGVSHALSFDTHVFINPDLTIHLFRPLVGEWVGLRSRSLYADDGVGMSDTELHDERGPIGRSNQSLLLDHR
jgi:Thioesterase-like superfamily